MNNLSKMLDAFEEFCTNEVISGKARSYKLAIQYLCDYLNIKQFDKESVENIKKTAIALRDYNSITYIKLLSFLSERRQSSYLLKGFINAGFNQFLRFIDFL
jgi:hypothetical protein